MIVDSIDVIDLSAMDTLCRRVVGSNEAFERDMSSEGVGGRGRGGCRGHRAR